MVIHSPSPPPGVWHSCCCAGPVVPPVAWPRFAPVDDCDSWIVSSDTDSPPTSPPSPSSAGLCSAGRLRLWSRRGRSEKCCRTAPYVGSAHHPALSLLYAFSSYMLWQAATADCTCRPSKRIDSAALATQGVQNAGKTRFWSTVMKPRHATLRASGATAPHRAVHGAGPSIKAAPTNTHCTTREAVAVSLAFRTSVRRRARGFT